MNTSISLKKFVTSIYKIVKYFFPKRTGLRVLTYHSIVQSDGDLKTIWDLTKKNFEDHISYIKKNKKIINPQDMDKSKYDDSLLITFDDGSIETFNVAKEVLESYLAPYTVFVITDFIGKDGYLTLDMLIELDKSPLVTIGSHGITHRRLTQCNLEELVFEVKGSKSFLEDSLGHQIDLFSYPHGEVNKRVISCVEESGYKYAFGSYFDNYTTNYNKFNINRNEIWSYDGLNNFKSKLAGNWDWLRFRESFK